MKKDIAGVRFGRLRAIKPNGSQGNNTKWLCICDCGNKVSVNISSLTMGRTRSCGCLRKENTSSMFKKHGFRSEKLYSVYCTMKQRCYNPNNQRFSCYGGRGISICDEWQADYLAFRKWALDNGYEDGKSIDRINNDGNYEPSNCRWVNTITQANNKRNNPKIEYGGESHTIAEWARIKGLSYHTLYERINVHKWALDRAMETPQKGAK